MRQLLLSIFVAFCTFSASAEVLNGRVEHVVDGDTLDLVVGRTKHRIRLADIDTPEKGQNWGSSSKQALEVAVLYRDVSVHVSDRDRYGRLVGKVWLDGRDINRQLVEQGHAWAYRQYLTDETLLQVEATARDQRRGLWSIAGPVAPWLWRRGTRAPTLTFAGGELAEKNYCGDMSSCEEAYRYFTQGGLARLDGDGDGIPCESLCR